MCVARADFRGTEPNAGRQAKQLETERFEHGGEERVLLEAISAAPRCHQLGLQVGEVQRDSATEQDV